MRNNIINKIIKRNPINSWRLRRFKRIYQGTILVISALVLALSPLAPKAFATSAYDSAIVPTDHGDLQYYYHDASGNHMRYGDFLNGDFGGKTLSDLLIGSCGSGGVTVANILSDKANHSTYEAIRVEGGNVDYIWSDDATGTQFYNQFYWPDSTYHPALETGHKWGFLKIGSGIDVDPFGRYNPKILCYGYIPYGDQGSSLMLSWDKYNGASNHDSLDTGLYEDNFPPDSMPAGYAGQPAPFDNDHDGLTSYQESEQSTSDSTIDTDGDGISDYVESRWNINHDAEFCDTSTPKHCAEPHPDAQDVYVEMDWMDNTSPSESYKPSDTQIGLVSDVFADKGVYFHADTGYYGGGNQLSTYTAPLEMEKDPLVIHDYFDYKTSNFSSNRQGIWRYMISGYNFSDNTSSSGATYAGSDNIFVSYGLIKNDQFGFGWTDLDTALAGTMLHEIGHSLCLSDIQRYSHQNSECEFAGVDSGAPAADDYPDYTSVMNYADQMGMIDYSTGVNGSPDDHNDWASIENRMSDFTLWDYDTDHDFSPGVSKSPALSIGITTEKAKQLKAKGLLKTGKAIWHHLKVAPNKGNNSKK